MLAPLDEGQFLVNRVVVYALPTMRTSLRARGSEAYGEVLSNERRHAVYHRRDSVDPVAARFASGYTIGAFIHALLVVALVLFLVGCWAVADSCDARVNVLLGPGSVN